MKQRKTKYHCEKCDHRWIGRENPRPVACPRCKRYDYNKKEKQEVL